MATALQGQRRRGSKGGSIPCEKLPCSCDVEPSSVASVIRDTLIEQSRSRYSNRAVTVFLEKQCNKLRMIRSLVGGG